MFKYRGYLSSVIDVNFYQYSDYPIKEQMLNCICTSFSSKGFTSLNELNLASMSL